MNRQTNIEFVTELMEFSRHGALAQVFVIEAMGKYARKVANTPLEELRDAFGDNPLVHPNAWHGVATEIAEKLERRYDRPAEDAEPTTQWRNHYVCPNCDCRWHDTWSAQCNDTCPECRLDEIEPHDSEEVEA